MATQTGAFPFTGTFKNVIGYRVGDKSFFRSMPEKVRQSVATKRASRDFGKASTYSRLLRQALHKTMDLPQDRFLANRLNRSLAQVLRADKTNKPGNKTILPEHLPMLEGFAFNRERRIDGVLIGIEANIEEQEDISISIPAITSIKHTRNTTHIEIKAIAISANFTKHTTSEAIIINVRKSFEPLQLTIPRPGHEATLIILQVRAFQEEEGELKPLADKKYCAADIISVLPPIPLMKIKVKHPTTSTPKTHKRHFTIKAIPQLE